MDDTLVRSNLDIKVMYRGVFGREPPAGYDILKEIRALTPPEQDRAFGIIAAIESESRSQMTLMPGCLEVLRWLAHHQIPRAIVTRNGRSGTDYFCQTFFRNAPGLEFCKIITRDDGMLPKPDPAAMELLARESFVCDPSEILMVGDSLSNDVAFGKNAGTHTALLVTESDNGDDDDDTLDSSATDADMVVTHLAELPRLISQSFAIAGPLGNTPEANQKPLHGSPPPSPETALCRAVVQGDTAKLSAVLQDLSLDDLLASDPENGNTALIWACETGNAQAAKLLWQAIVHNCQSKSNSDSQTQMEADEGRLSAFLNHRGFLGATALNRAARRGHTDLLKLLLEEEQDDDDGIPGRLVDKDLPNEKLQYPLHFAAFKRNPGALEYLLQQGANPWVLDRKGRTPLQDTDCETCQNLLRTAMGNYYY